jgi:hypothetical protein
MGFKPNYNFQKAERDRAKQAKKEEKARERAERKRAEAGEGTPEADGAETPPDAVE